MFNKMHWRHWLVFGRIDGLALLFWVAVLALVWLSAQMQAHRPIRKIEFRIVNTTEEKMLRKSDIARYIQQVHPRIKGIPRKGELKLAALEEALEQHPYVANAEVYLGQNDVLKVDIWQRIPQLYCKAEDGTSFYLDAEGVVMRSYGAKGFRALVASGYLPRITVEDGTKINHPFYQKLLILAQTIICDEVLAPLIDQIYVASNGEVFLVPKVGANKIFFGSLTDIRSKVRKLRKFYDKGVSKMGWNRYQIIRLEYDSIIIAKRAEKDEKPRG